MNLLKKIRKLFIRRNISDELGKTDPEKDKEKNPDTPQVPSQEQNSGKLEEKRPKNDKENTKTEDIELTNEEVVPVFVERIYLKLIEEMLPDKGTFQPIVSRYEIPNTRNIGGLRIEVSSKGDDYRVLWGDALRDGTNIKISQKIIGGITSRKMKEYLRNKKNYDVIYQNIEELSKAVDDYWKREDVMSEAFDDIG